MGQIMVRMEQENISTSWTTEADDQSNKNKTDPWSVAAGLDRAAGKRKIRQKEDLAVNHLLQEWKTRSREWKLKAWTRSDGRQPEQDTPDRGGLLSTTAIETLSCQNKNCQRQGLSQTETKIDKTNSDLERKKNASTQ
jgi:hypothetical protein